LLGTGGRHGKGQNGDRTRRGGASLARNTGGLMSSIDHAPEQLPVRPETKVKTSGRSVILTLLLLVSMINLLDKAIFTVLTDPVKREFSLNDAQIGLLGGLAFGFFFALAGIPLGIAADRGNRRNLVAICMAFWSAATIACGMATNFPQLLVSRLLVGAGESGSGPAALSMISDLYPARERATAMAVYYLAVPIGGAIALSFGGWALHEYGWRQTLILAGLPGLVLAGFILLFVREPIRLKADGAADRAPPPPLRQTLRYIAGQRSLLHVMAAITLVTMAINGFGMWMFPFFTRVDHLSPQDAGWQITLATNPASAVGMLASAMLADRLARREERWRVWVPAMIVLTCLPAAYGAVTAQDVVVGLAFAGFWLFAATSWYGIGYGVCQSLVEPRMRATLSSILLLLTTLIGFGIGPLLSGLISDAMAPSVGARSIGYGMVGTNLLTVWSAAHFILASRSLKSDLRRAASGA
jgi:MFS family permease